jgi:small conductance mechanosensitive channel
MLERIFGSALTEFASNFFSMETLRSITLHGIKTLLIFIIAYIVLRLGRVLIDQTMKPKEGKLQFVEEKRAKTLATLLKSILQYVVYFMTAITVLEEFNVPTTSVLAGAGIVGLAIGFGAQNLVKDVITGFFLILENQFSVGEHVTIGGIEGIVEEMGLRVTKVRAWGGELNIIPNGEISMVTNHNRGSMRALVEVGIAYEEDIDKAIAVIERVCGKLAKENADITEGPMVLGVQNLGDSDVVIRIVAYTRPLAQWSIERILRKQIKEAFDLEGIEIPYPRTVIIQKSC